MLNKYKKDGSLIEYKVKYVNNGTASNGNEFTTFQISSSKKENDKFVYENYTIFSWQKGLKLCDEDKVTLKEITGVEVKESEYQGKKTIKKTIFAEVNVIPSNPQPQDIEVIDDNTDFEPVGDDLPF